VLFGRGDERLGTEMAAMAGAAGDGHVRVGDLGDVILVDIFGHLEHQARGGLFFLGVVSEVEAWTAVGAEIFRVSGMAGAAMHAEFTLPAFHDVVDLLAGEVFGQHLQVGGRGVVVLLRRRAACRWRGLRGLSDGGGREESRGEQGYSRSGKRQGRGFQAGVLLVGMVCWRIGIASDSHHGTQGRLSFAECAGRMFGSGQNTGCGAALPQPYE
jgi:hypothetical protein